MNAFDPDYVKTYMPEFISSIRVEEQQRKNGEKFGSKSRATRESVHGKTVNTISAFPKTKRVSLKPTEFLVYSRAGMPKEKK